MKWIGILTTGFFMALAVWFAGQYFYDAKQTPDIRLVVTSWPTGQLMYAADQLGYFDQFDLKVKIIDTSDQYSRAVNIVSSDEADAGVFVLSEPLLLTLTGKPMEVVLGLDYSAGADGLVVAHGITNISELESKTIAYQPGSFGDLLLQEALKRANLSIDQIETRSLPPSEASRAFLLGEVEGAVTVEPFLSQALVRNGSKVLFSSAESPGLLPDVVAFNKTFVDTYPVEVRKFVQAWLTFKRDIEHNESIKNQAYSIVAIRLGETLDTVENEFAGIHILSEQDVFQAFSEQSSPASLYQSGQRFLQFFNQRMGIDISNIELEKVLNNKYVVN